MPTDLTVQGNKVFFDNTTYPCAIGKGGIGIKQKEGDGITPLGTHPLRFGFYRKDRHKKPLSSFLFLPLSPGLGWCDDPKDSYYNRLVPFPYSAQCENLYRDDHVYDIILIVGYNDDPVIRGKGSAIFIHVAREHYTPTEGCIALSLQNLLTICEKITPHSRLIVQQTHCPLFEALPHEKKIKHTVS